MTNENYTLENNDPEKQYIDLLDGEIVDLVDELAECYEDDGHFPMVRHPLVVSIPHHDVQNKWANASLEFKKEKLAKAEANKDWHNYIYIHERPFRLQAFARLIGDGCLEPVEYNALLREVWIDSENPSVNAEFWFDLFEDATSHLLMTEEERDYLKNAPDTLTIYRGYKEPVEEDEYADPIEDSLSWTTDYDMAVFFAKRWALDSDVSYVHHAQVPKTDVKAYFKSRGESEIILTWLPDTFKILKTEEIER
tara:strand:- start:8460 stop:9215 length:756 start_codon:yes stop_codon:yes gene_type:complete